MPIQSSDQLTYLALGDSYTVGTGVGPNERWPDILTRRLRTDYGLRMDVPTVVARNGWRTDNLDRALGAETPDTRYDLVSLLIGVNDQYQGFDVQGFTRRFQSLLDRAVRLAGGDNKRVFVVSIPDYSFTLFGGGNPDVSAEVALFNAAAASVANSSEVAFLSIVDISRQGLDDPELVSEDNLHPSAKQYRRWVEEVILASVAAQLDGD